MSPTDFLHGVEIAGIDAVKLVHYALLASIALGAAVAARAVISATDPYKIVDVESPSIAPSNVDTSGLTPRSLAINPAQKTLVLITAGQSLMADVFGPTIYVPANGAVIDNFNIYDGEAYPFGPKPALGTGGWGGNVGPYLGDLFISNGIFDRVIVVPIAVTGTAINQWVGDGPYAGRFAVAMKRLAARGITPSTPGVMFMVAWGQGEKDTDLGTSQAVYASNLNAWIARVRAAGFTGRIFVNVETMSSGVVSSAIQAAQMSVVDNVGVWQGANWDALGESYRVDGTHPSDAGAPTFATNLYNAICGSGALF
ncbi:sialate O-acetylesterase [Bradyrhizobium sp. LeoA1S1]